MDFSFSAAELAFADEARRWLEANVPAAWRRDHCWTRVEDPLWIEIARDWQRRLYDGGWAAISWPREHGGRGATRRRALVLRPGARPGGRAAAAARSRTST